MKLDYSQQFDADPDTVLKMFCDPAYHQKLQQALGSINVRQKAHSDDGNEFSITLAYEVKSEVPLPGFAKKILGETTEVEQTETWNRAQRTGSVAVRMKNLPGGLNCRTALEEKGGGTRKTFDWDISVKVPLVGGKIEKLIVDDVRSKDAQESAAASRLLADYS